MSLILFFKQTVYSCNSTHFVRLYCSTRTHIYTNSRSRSRADNSRGPRCAGVRLPPPPSSPKMLRKLAAVTAAFTLFLLEQLPPGQLAGWTGFLGFQVSRGAAISRGALSCRCPTCYDFSLSRACRCGTIAG